MNKIENYNLIKIDGGLPTTDQVIDSLEIQRAKFEKWMSNNGQYKMIVERINGRYVLITTSEAWEVWQAALKAQ